MIKLTRKFLFYSFLSIVLIGCLCFGIGFFRFLNKPLVLPENKPISFVFIQGMSVKSAAAILKKHNAIPLPSFFVMLVRLKSAEHNLKAGEYLITPGLLPSQLLEKMLHGDVVRHAFTMVEGWTFSQVITAINNNPYIKHTILGLTPDEIMNRIGHPGELPEGRFAPDTYLFSGEITDVYILNKAYQLMQKRLQKAWDARPSNSQYSCPYEALIVASLIEKETAFVPEKPMISGVILRRLNKNMLLQFDPTVIYGLGAKYKGKLSKADLLINSPYNTYLYKGLPPSPISFPSVTSIEAALHPLDGTSLYYVSKGDGTHKFSDTLEEHTAAIRKYLRN